MSATDVVWSVGRPTIGGLARVATRLRAYGRDRMPADGGIVVACNHYSWIDPVVLGAVSTRTLYYMAKVEAHRVPGLGPFIRLFGCFPVRRGESDRDAVRTMRQVVRDGHALGLFVEGTRQLSGVPGPVQPGAAMVAVQESVPIIPVAVHGSQTWRPGNMHPVSLAFGEPLLLEGLPRGGKGYREASAIVQTEIKQLWDWLVEMHRVGRPREATPPAGLTGTRDDR